MSGTVFAFALLQVLFISRGYSRLFADSDAGWHIRIGERILRNHAVPRTDPFSYTRIGKPWFAWEWLGDVALGGAHRLGGLPAVALLVALVIALTAWGVARLSLALGGNFLFTGGAVVLLLSTTSMHWLARPHVFSWALGLAFVAIAEVERRSAGTRWLWLAPPLACLWANVHGSFPLAPAILFIYGLGEWLEDLAAAVSQRERAGAARHALRFFLASLLSVCATFVNPYGAELHSHVAAYLGDRFLMDNIAEFRSFDFHQPGAMHVELLLLVLAAGAFLLIRQRAYGPALLSLALLHASLQSERHIATAAVVLLPLAVSAISAESRRLAALRRFHAFCSRLAAVDRQVIGAVPLGLFVLVSALALAVANKHHKVGFAADHYPVRAIDWLAWRDPSDCVFAPDQWGGYLIYRFDGARKVFVDGRSDFYGDDFIARYGQVLRVEPLWQQVLLQENVRYVLIAPDRALASALLLAPGWKRVYVDSVAAIYQRTDAQKN